MKNVDQALIQLLGQDAISSGTMSVSPQFKKLARAFNYIHAQWAMCPKPDAEQNAINNNLLQILTEEES